MGDGPWFLIGTNASYTINKSGILTIMINDNSPDDNQGNFVVEYRITNESSDGSNGITNSDSNGTNIIENTSNSKTNNVSNIEDYKFTIRNPNDIKLNFQLSPDELTWYSISLNSLSQNAYWYDNQQYEFFRIKSNNGKTKTYKVKAGKKYKLDWNSTEQCWDLYSDGDR